MSSSVADEFSIPETKQTAQTPSELDDLFRQLIDAFRSRDVPFAGWALRFGAGATDQFAVGVRVPPLRLHLERTEDGGFVASDAFGAAYGSGGTVNEATANWETLAREHYEDLLREEQRLHPRLRRQLAFLRQLFG